jgi:thiol-disulfide isomerase/thioredoxin
MPLYRRGLVFILFLWLFTIITGALKAHGQGPLPIYDFDQLEPILNKRNDTTYLINFWASWCVPCLKELPAFEQVRQKYSDRPFKMLMVSLDFPRDMDTKLIPTIQKYNLNAEVVVLDDPDANAWINKVDPSWSGAIPATLIFNSSSRTFYEKGFTFNELDQIVESKLNEK